MYLLRLNIIRQPASRIASKLSLRIRDWMIHKHSYIEQLRKIFIWERNKRNNEMVQLLQSPMKPEVIVTNQSHICMKMPDPPTFCAIYATYV
jgi:hypothetical protein